MSSCSKWMSMDEYHKAMMTCLPQRWWYARHKTYLRSVWCMVQVGYKHMLYMSMHAEAVVDLVETKHKEVQFRQVQGDFSLLQGKFLLQEAESEVTWIMLLKLW